MECGILTIAIGKKRYIEMAKAFALSAKINIPQYKLALVTDSTDPSLKKLFDFLIEPDLSFGSGIIQKTNMYNYSPFNKTLFVDADCMFVRDISFLFDAFKGNSVSVLGKKVTDGKLFGISVDELKKKKQIEYLLSFNGGVYYFEKSLQAEKIFDTVKIIRENYSDYGLNLHRGERNEEGVMSIAMSIHHSTPVPDSIQGMYTPVGQSGKFSIDVLRRFCEFTKHGVTVTPAIMHFGGGYPEAFHFKREYAKLKLVYYYKFPRPLSSILINVCRNPFYATHVFFYRIIKKLIKGGKLKFLPALPMFRFE